MGTPIKGNDKTGLGETRLASRLAQYHTPYRRPIKGIEIVTGKYPV